MAITAPELAVEKPRPFNLGALVASACPWLPSLIEKIDQVSNTPISTEVSHGFIISAVIESLSDAKKIFPEFQFKLVDPNAPYKLSDCIEVLTLIRDDISSQGEASLNKATPYIMRSSPYGAIEWILREVGKNIDEGDFSQMKQKTQHVEDPFEQFIFRCADASRFSPDENPDIFRDKAFQAVRAFTALKTDDTTTFAARLASTILGDTFLNIGEEGENARANFSFLVPRGASDKSTHVFPLCDPSIPIGTFLLATLQNPEVLGCFAPTHTAVDILLHLGDRERVNNAATKVALSTLMEEPLLVCAVLPSKEQLQGLSQDKALQLMVGCAVAGREISAEESFTRSEKVDSLNRLRRLALDLNQIAKPGKNSQAAIFECLGIETVIL